MEHMYRGRAKKRKPKQMFIAAKQFNGGLGAQGLQQKKLQRLARRLEELLRHHSQLRGQGPGVLPQKTINLLRNVQTDAHEL
eukprot:7117318-Karenia_brevis.AAC.1